MLDSILPSRLTQTFDGSQVLVKTPLMSDEKIKIELSPSEALVLFDFLSRFADHDRLEIVDQAEEKVLWDIHSDLESSLTAPLDPNYLVLLAKARAVVRDIEG